MEGAYWITSWHKTRGSANSALSSTRWRARNYRNLKDGPKCITWEKQPPPFLRALVKSRKARCAQPVVSLALFFSPRVSLDLDRFGAVLNTHSCPQDQLKHVSITIMLNLLTNQALHVTNRTNTETAGNFLAIHHRKLEEHPEKLCVHIVVYTHPPASAISYCGREERRQTD